MSDETAYIILFRGVGGATQLPVKQLRAVLSEAGFSSVETYINSGNAVLRSSMEESAVTEAVAALVKEKMAFDKAVFARNAADWAELIAQNPFPEAVGEPTKLHAFALERPPEPQDVEALQAKAVGTERFVVKGRSLYLHTPEGMGRSRFAPKIEPTLKVAMTARNWRTVLALGRMAGAI